MNKFYRTYESSMNMYISVLELWEVYCKCPINVSCDGKHSRWWWSRPRTQTAWLITYLQYFCSAVGAESIAGTPRTLLIVIGSMEKASVRQWGAVREGFLGQWYLGCIRGCKVGGQWRRWGGCHKQSTCRYGSSCCVFRAHGEKLLVSLVPKVKVGKRTGWGGEGGGVWDLEGLCATMRRRPPRAPSDGAGFRGWMQSHSQTRN